MATLLHVHLVRSANEVRLPQEFSSTIVPERIAAALSIVEVMVLIIATIIHTFNYKRDYHLPVDEVVRTDAAHTQLMAGHV